MYADVSDSQRDLSNNQCETGPTYTHWKNLPAPIPSSLSNRVKFVLQPHRRQSVTQNLMPLGCLLRNAHQMHIHYVNIPQNGFHNLANVNWYKPHFEVKKKQIVYLLKISFFVIPPSKVAAQNV